MSPQIVLPCRSSLPSLRNRKVAQNRSGSVAILVAMMMIVLFASLAFAVDLGHVRVVQGELQNAADGACLAAVNELPSGTASKALAAAQHYANLNHSYAGGSGLELIQGADVETGTWDRATRTFTVTDPKDASAARVTARRSAGAGNPVSLFFARALGQNEAQVSAAAVADRSTKWMIVARNKLQVGDGSNLNGISAYGRTRIEMGSNSKVLAGSKIGSLPDSVVQYTNTVGLPDNLIRDDVEPWYADHINQVIDDYQLGNNLPEQIVNVSVLNAWPPAGGVVSHTVYIVNGSVNIPDGETISLHDVIIAARGSIHVGQDSRVMNTGVPGNDINAGLFATGDIQIGQNAALSGVDMVAGHDIQMGQHLSAMVVGTVQAGNDIQLGQGPTVSGYSKLLGTASLVQ